VGWLLAGERFVILTGDCELSKADLLLKCVFQEENESSFRIMMRVFLAQKIKLKKNFKIILLRDFMPYVEVEQVK
jgi:hypothetical protein